VSKLRRKSRTFSQDAAISGFSPSLPTSIAMISSQQGASAATTAPMVAAPF
jgi:hypothetical protein